MDVRTRIAIFGIGPFLEYRYWYWIFLFSDDTAIT